MGFAPFRMRRVSTPTVYVILLCMVLACIIWINFEDTSSVAARARARAASRKCKGKRVFSYNLPQRFNQDLLDSCNKLGSINRCEAYKNGGFGETLTFSEGKVFGGDSYWWTTDPHSLEIIFHQRMKDHLCRVDDMNDADLFYVPFYPSLDFERSLSLGKTAKEDVDALALDLAAWIQNQPAYMRYYGKDHFLVLGTPTWSFRRLDRINDTWGSMLEYIPEFENMMKLEVERHPWAPGNSVGIPYPTGLHPAQDGDLLSWQSRVQASERNLLWSYVVFGTPNQDPAAETQRLLITQCAKSDSCQFVNCSKPDSPGCSKAELMELYLRSNFSAQPKGDTFTSEAIFESMLGGAVPIFMWKESAISQYVNHFPDDADSFSVYIPFDDLPKWTTVDARLAKFSVHQIAKLQATVLKLMPKLVYIEPGHWSSQIKDAADVALDSLAWGMKKTKKTLKAQKIKVMRQVDGTDDMGKETVGSGEVNGSATYRRQLIEKGWNHHR